MIKIEIHTLAGQLDIEIKKNEDFYILLVILSKSQYFQEDGRVWSGKIEETEKLFEIVNLIKECYRKPSVPTRITILDGRSIKINLKDDESQIALRLVDIDENTNESELIQKIKELTIEIRGNDAILQDYLDIFMD
ncbi:MULTISPECIES: hypothetical protein [unclassified Chryseobacterium]|uniref:hypothetical protein n=1 Tax=Chryseobacterium TaxID=59732 RepID=UPI000D3B2ED3|nr:MULTISPECIES: hypothetical protein [unclassified Chryseobacterium]PTT70313.1 hypothetical protein DBR25_18465 [Chryseobacterium sp. HMWF001]PVV61838.1 hypothetical protein DD829_01160 [Chryseobacterium sp. HMWF035]